MIVWTKARHTCCWIGSTGTATFEQKEHFYIQKVKPPHAPRSVWSQRARKRGTGEAWHFEYTLHERRNGNTYRIGVRYSTIEAAKQAAENLMPLDKFNEDGSAY